MILIKNARLILKGNETVLSDILIDREKIIKVAQNIDESSADKVYDVAGALTLPGGIDVHVHLREPGFEEKETIRTGTRAALAGGYTSIFPMPNIKPNPDNVKDIRAYQELIEKDALVNVYPYAAITLGSKGMEPVDFADIKRQTDINIFTDDGVGVQNDLVMRTAFEEVRKQGGIIACHTEDMTYRKAGSSVHDGARAKAMGWIGIPSETEFVQAERDLKLAYETGAKYHICHISAKETIEALRKYKALGCDCSGEITCHHLLLTEDDVKDTNYKMNPPLRTKEDREALIGALLDGTVDIIANDHAPHTEAEKARDMAAAPFGIVGLETSIPLIYTNFVKKGIFSLEQFQAFISTNPAKRFGLKSKGMIKAGYDADIIVLSDEERVIDKNKFYSKGKNTPFDGMTAQGFPIYTFVGGECKFEKGVIYE